MRRTNHGLKLKETAVRMATLALALCPACSHAPPSAPAKPVSAQPAPPVAQTPPTPVTTDPLVKELQELVSSKGQQAATESLKQEASAGPQNADGVARWGVFLALCNQNAAAKPVLLHSLALGAHHPIVGYMVADLALDEGHFEEAADAAQGEIKAAPEDPYGYYELGRASLRMGEIQQCVDAMKRCVALAPGFAAAYQILGNAYAERAEFAPAEEALKKAVDLDPSNPMAWNGLGRVYMGMSRIDDAQKTFMSAISQHPQVAELHEGLGQVCLLQPPNGISNTVAGNQFGTALTLKPNSAQAEYGLARLSLRFGSPPQAERWCRKAMAHAPGDSNMLYTLSQILRRQGKNREADALAAKLAAVDWSRKAQFLQREVDFNPDRIDVRLKLGDLYLRQGAYERAQHQFRMVLRKDPRNAEALRGVAAASGHLSGISPTKVGLRLSERQFIAVDPKCWLNTGERSS
jgi:tetratricopeptide (TPR) repeat protein